MEGEVFWTISIRILIFYQVRYFYVIETVNKVDQAELEGADSLLLGQTIYCQRQDRGRRGWGVDSRCRRDNSHCLVITTHQSNPYPLANLMF